MGMTSPREDHPAVVRQTDSESVLPVLGPHDLYLVRTAVADHGCDQVGLVGRPLPLPKVGDLLVIRGRVPASRLLSVGIEPSGEGFFVSTA